MGEWTRLMLFILFINDLAKYLDPGIGISLFADDCKIFKEICSLSDCMFLQRNLSKFVAYCKKFHLVLNIEKCKKITFSRLQNEMVKFDYSLNNQQLNEVQSINDLGVMLDAKLKYNEHRTQVCNKSMKMLGYVFRTCKNFKNVKSIKIVYSAFVRSKLEYCSQIWNPVLSKDSIMLEKVQRKFTRYLFTKKLVSPPGLTEFHYSPVLEMLNWRSLHSRRILSDLNLFYKIKFGIVQSTLLDGYVRVTQCSRSLRSQRSFVSVIGSSSTINRCISTIHSLNLDGQSFESETFRNAIRIAEATVPTV